MANDFRVEKDFIGTKEISNEKYYGIQTLRAKENFNISDLELSHFPRFVTSLAQVKKAAAIANCELGQLESIKKDAICNACDEIIAGKLHEHFIVDPIQGGAGTSTNMNANEVIANRALELLGHKKGEYKYLHPNNDVNLSQSTNDVYPTAIKITVYEKIFELIDAMQVLKGSFEKKAEEFKDVIKMGRTQLQDAVPMTLGQEFSTYAIMLQEDIERLYEVQALVREINLGATAIGTGINSHVNYSKRVERRLQEITKRPFVNAHNLIEATQDTGVFVQISGVLKRVATKISKTCNDLRLLSSGPRTGFNEINLPPMQPGSSIMPGKVNPVIPEVVNQVAYQVIGADVTITLASEGGQLQLNVFEPIIAYNILRSMTMLKRSFLTLSERCVEGITANRELCESYVKNSVGIVTALNPILGYETSAELAKEALKTGRSVYELALERELFTKEELDELLKPENMIHPML